MCFIKKRNLHWFTVSGKGTGTGYIDLSIPSMTNTGLAVVTPHGGGSQLPGYITSIGIYDGYIRVFLSYATSTSNTYYFCVACKY